MGRLDPCYAILSRPGTKFGHWDLGEFFITGEQEISDLMQSAFRMGLPKERGRALDFGCGLGRLTQALAGYFDECVGIDISDSMISRAKELCNTTRCRFLINDAATLPFPNEDFDLIYTSIVLQHIPERSLIRGYIAEFVRTLRTDGLLVMQIPTYIRPRNRLQPRRRLYEWLRGVGVTESLLYRTLGLTPILMNFLPHSEVCTAVELAAGRILSALPDNKAGFHIVSRTYYVTK